MQERGIVHFLLCVTVTTCLLNSCANPVEAQSQGAQGPVGPQGPPGPAGPTGPQGVQGLVGPPGIAAAGATGAQGATGQQGVQGQQGPSGRDGILGIQYVVNQYSIPPNSGGTTIGACPPGKIAISGGYGQVVPGVTIRESRPGQLSGQIPGEFDKQYWTVVFGTTRKHRRRFMCTPSVHSHPE